MPKLSEFLGVSEASTPANGYLHIIKSDGVGGYDSYIITYSDFISLISADITAIEELAGTKTTRSGQSASFTESYAAGTLIVRIVVQHVYGTVDLQVGSSTGAEDIIPNFTMTTGTETFTIDKVFENPLTLYVTRNSGTFNIIIHVIEGYQ